MSLHDDSHFRFTGGTGAAELRKPSATLWVPFHEALKEVRSEGLWHRTRRAACLSITHMHALLSFSCFCLPSFRPLTPPGETHDLSAPDRDYTRCRSIERTSRGDLRPKCIGCAFRGGDVMVVPCISWRGVFSFPLTKNERGAFELPRP